MILKFKNWEKYNPRKDIKKPWYFAFSNDFFSDSKLYELDNDERLFLIYLFCEASKTNKDGSMFFSREHYRVHSRLPDRVPNRAIKKLQQLQIIEQPRVRGMYVECGPSVQQTRLDQTRLEENNILPDSDKSEPRLVFDFDAIYKKYPRKEGKQKGLAICRTQIKTQNDFDNLSKAVDRYCEHLRKSGSESKFIKHFSTFMNSWRDWLDPETGSAEEMKFSAINNWLLKEKEKENDARRIHDTDKKTN